MFNRKKIEQLEGRLDLLGDRVAGLELAALPRRLTALEAAVRALGVADRKAKAPATARKPARRKEAT